VSVGLEKFESSKKFALWRNAVNDANGIVDVMGHRKIVTQVLDGSHVPRGNVPSCPNQRKVFHP
jgi:hypothetical protein